MKHIIKMENKLLIVLGIFFGSEIQVMAQPISLSGKVTDKITHAGLPAATIKIGKEGVVADNKGFFNISAESSMLKRYGMDFSCVGYKTYHISGIPTDDFLLIALEKTAGSLPEVVVGGSARAIIEKAIAAIPVNYPTTPFNLKGFERIYESINDSDYFYTSDALLNLYNTSYIKPTRKIQVAIEQNRSDSVNNIIMKKNILLSLLKVQQDIPVHWAGEYHLQANIDFVHGRSDFANVRVLDNHNFFPPHKIMYNGYKVYAIDFTAKEGKAGTEGTVYIDTASYAFVGASITANQRNLDKRNTAYTNHKRTFSYWQINYQQINGKWYYHDGHTEQHIMWRLHFGKDRYSHKAFVDFATLSIDTVNVQSIAPKDRAKKDDRATDLNIPGDINKWKEIDSLLNGGWLSKYISFMPMPAKRKQ